MPEPLALTLDAAAEALSVSPRTVRRLLDAGEFGRVKIGRAVRVSAASLQAYVDANTAQRDNPGRAGSDVREESTCREPRKRKRQDQDGVYQRPDSLNGNGTSPMPCPGLVEPRGIEPLTFALRTRRSPS
jgi:excisionase family DNA binding protein